MYDKNDGIWLFSHSGGNVFSWKSKAEAELGLAALGLEFDNARETAKVMIYGVWHLPVREIR